MPEAVKQIWHKNNGSHLTVPDTIRFVIVALRDSTIRIGWFSGERWVVDGVNLPDVTYWTEQHCV